VLHCYCCPVSGERERERDILQLERNSQTAILRDLERALVVELCFVVVSLVLALSFYRKNTKRI
jgi:hypothetical protein